MGFIQTHKVMKKYHRLIKDGDKVIMYLTPKMIGGLFKVKSKEYNGEVEFKDGNYPYKIKLSKVILKK